MNSAVFSPIGFAKIIAIAVFVVASNRMGDFGERLVILSHNYPYYAGVIAFLLLWAFCIVGLLATAFLERLWLRALIGLPAVLGAMVAVSYEQIAGAQIGYDSLAIMLEEVKYARQAATFFSSQLAIGAAIALTGYLAILWPSSQAKPVSRIQNTAQTGLALAPHAVIFFIVLVRAGYGTDLLPNQYKVPSLFVQIEAGNMLATDVNRDPVDIALTDAGKGPKHIVLILDESLRGDYIDINNPRGTTPSLLTYSDTYVNYGLAVSGANCSHSSRMLLRTGARAPNFQETLRKNPFIWDYARDAGYETVFIEAQDTADQLTKRMTLGELSKIDEFLYAEGDDPVVKDLDTLKILESRLKLDKPQFIYLVKSGVHFPYEDMYEAEDARFQRHLTGGFVFDAERLQNSYKNAIYASVDLYYKTLLSSPNISDAVILYTSDHGQNLLENGRSYAHCSVGNATIYEGIVPAMVITQNADWKPLFEEAAALNFDRASHFNIFPTLLALFGYDPAGIQKRYGPSLLDDVSAPRGFVTGVVTDKPRLSFGKRGELNFRPVREEEVLGLRGRSISQR